MLLFPMVWLLMVSLLNTICKFSEKNCPLQLFDPRKVDRIVQCKIKNFDNHVLLFEIAILLSFNLVQVVSMYYHGSTRGKMVTMNVCPWVEIWPWLKQLRNNRKLRSIWMTTGRNVLVSVDHHNVYFWITRFSCNKLNLNYTLTSESMTWNI